jgi:hemoglobin/transferrin/lactoferrin receptor protein
MKNILSTSCLLLIASTALAQNNNSNTQEEQSSTELSPLIVVAYKQARQLQEVAADVAIISAEQIQKTQSEDMAAALRYETNINIEDAGNRFGTSGINIRGIGSNRVAVEVDGVPNAKAFNIGSYSFATTQYPDVSVIKSIEVLKGPASTLYGSNALGGIVSIHTWDPQDLVGEQNHWRQFRLGFNGQYNGRHGTYTHAWNGDNNGVIFNINQRDGKGLQRPSTLAEDHADWDQQSIFAKWVTDIATGHQLSFNLQVQQRDQDTQIHSFIGVGRFSNTTALAGDDSSESQKLSATYDFMLNKSWADDGLIRLYRSNTEFLQQTTEQRFSRRGTPLQQNRVFSFEQTALGMEVNFTKQFNTGDWSHRLIYGVEMTQTDVAEYRDALETNLNTGDSTNVLLGEVFPFRDFPLTDVKELGVFVHDEIQLNDYWTLIPAVRFDRYDLSPERDALFDNNAEDIEVVTIDESDFSPKLGLLYQISDYSSVYAQYVRGFRAPPAEDVNIGFNIALFNYRSIPNPDLKSETSNGYEMGYRLILPNQRLTINGFYNEYNDLIVSRAPLGVDPDTQALLFQSQNIAKAQIHGVEMDYQWLINDQWQTHAALSWTEGKNKTNDQPLNSVSPPKAVLSVLWNSAKNNWQMGLYGRFSAAQDDVDMTNENLFKTPGYAVFDWLASYHFSPHSRLQFSVHNLTDKTYWQWQQVRNFDAEDPIINALTQSSRYFSISYSHQW